MVNVADIRDEESLRAWLEEQRPELAAALAHRAATRVLPVFGEVLARKGARGASTALLLILRPNLYAGVARKYATSEVIRVAKLHAMYFAMGELPTNLREVNRAGSALLATTSALEATDAADSEECAARAVRAAKEAFNPFRADQPIVANLDRLWVELRRDARLATEGSDLLDVPLWHGDPPPGFDKAAAEMRDLCRIDHPEHWAFWIRWWNGVLKGEPLDWELQRAVATEIPDKVWNAGPGPVAEAIESLRRRAAAEKTVVAERVEINPETGRLRLVPESALPDDIATYVRRKIAKALALFDGGVANQYAGLIPVFDILDAALTDAANMPIELFDACASASRMTLALGRQGNCPTGDQDERVADFLHRMREAGADILAHDPQTQAMVAKRNAIIGNDALRDARADMQAAAGAIAAVAEGALARTLPDDADLATNPAADPELRKVASFRLAGRLLKVAKFAAGTVGGAGVAIIGTSQVLEAIPVITNSPHFQRALEAIQRWLGL